MRGEANQNVPAISKQAVVGLIVFIANRFFSFSFRVGKRRDRSKERSLRRGIRREPIANSSEELSKGDRATCMKPSKCSPKPSKIIIWDTKIDPNSLPKRSGAPLGRSGVFWSAPRRVSGRSQAVSRHPRDASGRSWGALGWLWGVLRTSENGVTIQSVDDVLLMTIFHCFFDDFWTLRTLKLLLPSRRNANFYKIDVFH